MSETLSIALGNKYDKVGKRINAEDRLMLVLDMFHEKLLSSEYVIKF